MISVQKLKRLLEEDNLELIKNTIEKYYKSLNSKSNNQKNKSDIDSNEDEKTYFLSELEQILKTQTLERTKYYLKRLIKSLTETKKSSYNDLNLYRWKQYSHLITDSLWLFENRDSSGAHNAKYWGNFIPQIPNQLIQRFTKKGETILDPFVGSGTTLIEARRLGRNSIGIDLSETAIQLCKENLNKEKSSEKVFTEIIKDDCLKADLSQILLKHHTKQVQLIILHPPYWDIIKFSDELSDLSNSKSLDEFLSSLGKCVENFKDYLQKNRHLVLVIGDKYMKGEWVPLGFLSMQRVLSLGFKLKSVIIKNFEDTSAKRKQKELWRYRALAGGYYIFKHEYIFLFQKI